VQENKVNFIDALTKLKCTYTFIIYNAIFTSKNFLLIASHFITATKALLISVLFWLFLTHLTIVLDQFLVTESVLWKITSLILPHSGLLYGIVAFTIHTNFGESIYYLNLI